ncbi:MAG: peptidoglycan-associated lipoprotein Pal [Nitrospiraceae bacterium]|nr:MAG: peptidoglycan-associated lipoprotein Pal [Nitrospiraceae bacterium]
MMKKIVYSIAVLSLTFLLISCGAWKTSKVAGVSDMEDNKGVTGEDKEAVAWEKVWEEALSQGEGVKLTPDAKADVNDVLFDYDRYNIREDARPALNAAASYLNKKREIHIVIEGHSDERGTNEYNLALGEKRARATKNYLRSLGVSPSRVSTVTYGEEKPLCTDSSESCWQRNRRSSIKLSDLD